jgi:hypothetical protein
MCKGFRWGNLKDINCQENLGADGRIMLKRISKYYDRKRVLK